MLHLTWLVYFAFGMIPSSIPQLVTPVTQALHTWNGALLLYIPLALPLGLLIDRFEATRGFYLLYTKFIRKHPAIDADE